MTTTATSLGESLLAPLDRVRSAVFVRVARVDRLRPLLLQKGWRVPLLISLHAGVALILAVLAPTLLLVLGPLLLGVPHLLADVRYLVLRPTFSRRARGVLLAGCALLLGLRVLELTGLPGLTRVELGVAGLLGLAAIAVATPQRRRGRVLSAVAVTIGVTAAALAWPRGARLVLGHGHNIVALFIWAFMFCRSRARALGVVGVLLGLAGVLLTTPIAWWGFHSGAPASFGLDSLTAADSLAPGVQSAPRALGIVASFAFLQSVHYAIWLHAVPQEATRGEGTLSFRMSFRALVSDFGRPGLVLAALLVLALPLAGWLAPLRAQATYLSLSAFHGYLELAALAVFWVCGRPAEPIR
jgi:hypothetical protein